MKFSKHDLEVIGKTIYGYDYACSLEEAEYWGTITLRQVISELKDDYVSNNFIIKEQINKLQEALTGQIIEEGREIKFFANNFLIMAAPVANLVDTLKKYPFVVEQIESHFDNLFKDMCPNEDFIHMDIVISLLYVLFLADHPKFKEIAKVFINSNSAEIGRLRRFAKSICHD